jgi:hypothetical protein
VAAVRGGTVTVPAGQYVIGSTLQLPKAVKIEGATQRGEGTAPNGFGSSILAAFEGPVFAFTPNKSTSADILIQSLNLAGNKAKYGVGHGLLFTSCSNIHLRDMVVGDFGGDNIHFETPADGRETYNFIAKDVYSAQAGHANFYVAGEYSELHNCKTDGAQYGLYVAKQGHGLMVNDCHFEGHSVTGMHILASRLTIISGRVVQSPQPGAINATGLYCNAPQLRVSALELIGGGGEAGWDQPGTISSGR